MAKANDKRNSDSTDGYEDKLVGVFRTSKVIPGGRKFGFSALIVRGDGKGRVGYGHGKSSEVPLAIQKAVDAASKNMVKIELNGNTVYHEIMSRHGASKVLIKPAEEGTGIIAGNAMRAVFEVMGVENILAKCIGSTNPLNVVRATLKGLMSIQTPQKIAAKRGKKLEEIVGDFDE